MSHISITRELGVTQSQSMEKLLMPVNAKNFENEKDTKSFPQVIQKKGLILRFKTVFSENSARCMDLGDIFQLRPNSGRISGFINFGLNPKIGK